MIPLPPHRAARMRFFRSRKSKEEHKKKETELLQKALHWISQLPSERRKKHLEQLASETGIPFEKLWKQCQEMIAHRKEVERYQ